MAIFKSFGILTLIALMLVTGLILPAGAEAAREVTTFEVPDVNDDFCGPKMQMAFCRCAFEGEGCDAVKMEQSQVRDFVEREFKEWVGTRIEAAAEECLARDGFWNTPTRQCFTCTEGEVRDGKQCLPPGSTPSGTEEVPDECALRATFKNDWQSLATFTRPEEERSDEAKNHQMAYDALVLSVTGVGERAFDTTISSLIESQIKRYKDALESGVALDRDTAFSGLVALHKALPESVPSPLEILFDSENFSESVAAAFVPASTTEAIPSPFLTPTAEALKPFVTIGLAYTALGEARASVVDGVNTAFSKLIAEAPLLSLSAEDGAFMQTAHNEARLVDEVYASSALATALARRSELLAVRAQTERFNEVERWRKAEYERVKASIETQCTQ